jgi:transcriptional regulator GlxA family with amidase domain
LPELVSGRIRFQQENYRHWWELLPSTVFARRQAESMKWLEATLGFVTSEANAQRPGGQTLVSRLTDLLVLHVIRSHLATLDGAAAGGPRWLTALADPQMGAALALLHQKLAQPWTVRGLARQVGMSRSAFAARFTRLVGEPPLHYLTRLRMQKAAGLLRGSLASTTQVAEQVGYVSDTAFCKAFKRAFGKSPGSFRRAEKGAAQSKAA